jgi:hypothetical protein
MSCSKNLYVTLVPLKTSENDEQCDFVFFRCVPRLCHVTANTLFSPGPTEQGTRVHDQNCCVFLSEIKKKSESINIMYKPTRIEEGMKGAAKWIPPVKPSLAQAEHLPRLDREMLLLIEQKKRELRKAINKLRVDNKVPGRRNEVKKSDRPIIEKKIQARRGFVDRVKAKVYAGKGGDGNVAFARGPNLRVAPPSGGDAGKGGSVFVEVDERLSSLVSVSRQLRAGLGGNGGTSGRTGADGANCIVRVPRGTLVSKIVPKEAPSFVEHEDENFSLRAKAKTFTLEPLVDLDAPAQRFCLAEGGKVTFA